MDVTHCQWADSAFAGGLAGSRAVGTEGVGMPSCSVVVATVGSETVFSLRAKEREKKLRFSWMK